MDSYFISTLIWCILLILLNLTPLLASDLLIIPCVELTSQYTLVPRSIRSILSRNRCLVVCTLNLKQSRFNFFYCSPIQEFSSTLWLCYTLHVPYKITLTFLQFHLVIIYTSPLCKIASIRSPNWVHNKVYIETRFMFLVEKTSIPWYLKFKLTAVNSVYHETCVISGNQLYSQFRY